MEYRSRLRNRVRQSLYKNTVITIAAIIVIVAVLLFFGLQLLVKLSLLLGNIKSVGEIPFASESAFMLPPTLDPLAEATNSAVIAISGIGSSEGQTIEIFLNDEYKTNALVDKDLRFSIDELRLETGINTIRAKAKQGDQESEFTQEVALVFETTPPALEVKEPFDGQVVKKTSQVKVAGKTEPEVSIVINEFLSVVDSGGNFSFTFPLKEGENVIKVVARDRAGNQTTNEIKVIFEP